MHIRLTSCPFLHRHHIPTLPNETTPLHPKYCRLSSGIVTSMDHSPDHPDGASHSAETQHQGNPSESFSHLENLPAELREQILRHVPDLTTLHALVHASPVMHDVYLASRDSLLRSCLDRELDGVFLDAYACLMSRVFSLGTPQADDMVVGFLMSYCGWLTDSTSPPLVEPDHLRWLAAFHRSVARPFVDRYTPWARGNRGTATSSSAADEKATDSERVHVFRALYRYQTFRNLFGQSDIGLGTNCFNEINELFFCNLVFWDAEAIDRIELFSKQTSEDVFSQVKWDCYPDNPSFRQPNGVFNLDDVNLEEDVSVMALPHRRCKTGG